eukprot:gene4935-15200_t
MSPELGEQNIQEDVGTRTRSERNSRSTLDVDGTILKKPKHRRQHSTDSRGSGSAAKMVYRPVIVKKRGQAYCKLPYEPTNSQTSTPR